MKKYLILFVLLFYVQNVQARDFYQYCSLNTPNRNISGTLASLSGFNGIARNAAESQIKKEIKKETGSEFKIKIENFFASNILKGEIKSIKAISKKYAYDGIYLSDINVRTICSYNHLDYRENKLYFKENMVLRYETDLTQDDLEKTIDSQKIDKTLASILKKVSKYSIISSFAKSLKFLAIPIKIDENNNGKLYIEDIKTSQSKTKLIGYIVILKND